MKQVVLIDFQSSLNAELIPSKPEVDSCIRQLNIPDFLEHSAMDPIDAQFLLGNEGI